jgi:hypothetical protein
MQDPNKLCDNCNHGSDYCVSICDYFLIKGLREKYPKETEVLYKKIRRDTIKMIKKQEYYNDEALEEEDDGEN